MILQFVSISTQYLLLQKKQQEKMSYHQMFITRTQKQLLQKTFQPNEEELEFAKQSLIEKHKISNGIQQLLFCKKVNQSYQEQFLSINQRNLIQTQRKKYIDFIKKNYNQKLSEELFNISKLKTRMREFEKKKQQESKKQFESKHQKKLVEPSEIYKRKKELQKPSAGKKKIKTDNIGEKVDTKTKKKQSKKQPEKPFVPELKQLPVAEQFEQNPSPNQSVQLNLINSLSQEQFQDHYE